MYPPSPFCWTGGVNTHGNRCTRPKSVFSRLVVLKWFNSKLSWETEFGEASPKASTKKSKRKSEDDLDFAGSFQGKKMHVVSSNHSSHHMTCILITIGEMCFQSWFDIV